MTPTQTTYTFETAVLAAEQQLLAADLFYGHGLLNAYDEAVYAAQFCIGWAVADAPDWDAAYPMDAQQRLSQLIAQRMATRKPLAYLTREAYLYGYRFYVDERVIVPRSLLAQLLLERFEPWVIPDAVTDVLELCTGSGCLAIIAADVFVHAQVDAVDIDPDALAVARHNVAAYGFDDCVQVHQSDLYTALPAGKRYDVIVTNPPYVNQASMDALPPEYRAEPAIALAGGTDGMDLVRTIIAQARHWLKPSGILVVEIGNEYEHANTAFAHLPLIWLDTSNTDDAVFLLRAQDLV